MDKGGIMKKALFICFFTVFTNAFSRSEKLITVDYSYILDNYYKTQSYNKTLHKLKDNLEKKYQINFDDRSTSDEKKRAMDFYKKTREEFTSEVAMDIDIAIAFTGQTENYNYIIQKNAVLYGKKRAVKDISKNILEFLNDVYFHDLTIKDEKKLKNDLYIL